MTRVKICGVTRMQDALLAADLGASAIGFVFWPGSPRFIDAERASAIARALPALVSVIGVFVDQPAEEVQRVAQRIPLTAVQLHGNEPPAYAQRILQPVLRSVAVDEGFVAESLDAIPPEITVLLDAHDPVRRGGTGRTIDWRAAAAAAARRPVFLSGGLNPANVVDAITSVRPYGVDLSSGVESSPGVKDPARLRALFEAIGATVEHHD
jgi:phosphoribosylanthranilate isomerase